MARPPIIHHLCISLFSVFDCSSTHWSCIISSSSSGQRSILQVIQGWEGLGILITPHPGPGKWPPNESFKMCCRCLQMSSILVQVENYAVALHTVGVPPPPPLPRLFRERQQIHICHIWISAVAPSTTCHLNEARKSNGLASSSLATTEQMNTYRDEIKIL